MKTKIDPDELFQRYKEWTLLGPHKFRTVILLAQKAIDDTSCSTVAEIGVFNGGVTFALAEIALTVHAYDTFEGMVNVNEEVDGTKLPDGRFKTKQTALQELRLHSGIQVFKGTFPETAADTKYSFVHLDIDTYHGIKESLLYLKDHMMPGGIIVVDDYTFKNTPGCTKAVDELSGTLLPPHIKAGCQALFFF